MHEKMIWTVGTEPAKMKPMYDEAGASNPMAHCGSKIVARQYL